MKDCFFISPQINVHMKSLHKLLPKTVLYKNMLKSAIRYTGLAELDVLLNPVPVTKIRRSVAHPKPVQGSNRKEEEEEDEEEDEEDQMEHQSSGEPVPGASHDNASDGEEISDKAISERQHSFEEDAKEEEVSGSEEELSASGEDIIQQLLTKVTLTNGSAGFSNIFICRMWDTRSLQTGCTTWGR